MNVQDHLYPSDADPTLEYECACLERDLGQMEQHVFSLDHAELHGFDGDLGDLGDVAGKAAGAGAGLATLYATGGSAGAVASGAANVAAGTYFAAQGVGGGAALAAGGGALLAAAPAAVVGGGIAWLASWRADLKNIARLRAKIERLKTTLRGKLAKTRWEGRKRRLKRRYARKIKRAQRRLDRIERVMKRRIDRRKAKGKALTARQRKIMAALMQGKNPSSAGSTLAQHTQQAKAKLRRRAQAQQRMQQLRRRRGGASGGLMQSVVRAGSQVSDGGYMDDLPPDAADLPASSLAEDALMRGGGGMGLPFYRQPAFMVLAGAALIAGALYFSRKNAA